MRINKKEDSEWALENQIELLVDSGVWCTLQHTEYVSILAEMYSSTIKIVEYEFRWQRELILRPIYRAKFFYFTEKEV